MLMAGHYELILDARKSFSEPEMIIPDREMSLPESGMLFSNSGMS
jgi:hypothetical protein